MVFQARLWAPPLKTQDSDALTTDRGRTFGAGEEGLHQSLPGRRPRCVEEAVWPKGAGAGSWPLLFPSNKVGLPHRTARKAES